MEADISTLQKTGHFYFALTDYVCRLSDSRKLPETLSAVLIYQRTATRPRRITGHCVCLEMSSLVVAQGSENLFPSFGTV